MTITTTQREAALRLADDMNTPISVWADHVAHLLRELAAVPKSAIERFNETEGVDAMSPLERLRFFCSLSMTPQDWLDVEPFFDALAAAPQGEPVAWMHDGFVSTNFERVKHDESRNLASGFKAKPIIPLYAHPPQQRKPLSDEQIYAAISDQVFWATSKNFIVRVVRDVEAAHGITGGKE